MCLQVHVAALIFATWAAMMVSKTLRVSRKDCISVSFR